MTPAKLALRLAELALRIVPPLLRAGGERIEARDVDARRARLRALIAKRRG